VAKALAISLVVYLVLCFVPNNGEKRFGDYGDLSALQKQAMMICASLVSGWLVYLHEKK